MSDHDSVMTHQSAESTRGVADDEIDIAQLLAILRAGKWWIVGCLAGVIGLALIYLWITPYTYSADALLQIQARSNSPLGQMSGQMGAEAGGSSAASIFGLSQSTAQSEIPIITSREVLGKTVRDLNLATDVHPKYLPLIGGAFTDKSAKAEVSRFDVPDRLFDKSFELTILGSKQYKLSGPSGEHVLDGEVGKPVSGKTIDGATVRLFVRSVRASHTPITFNITQKAWLSRVKKLQENLTVQEVESGSSVLTISLEGNDPEKTTEIVNSVAQNYVRQNVEARSEQAAQSLEFLKSQLPKLKAKVNAAEAKLANYQENHQPVDLSAQAQALLSQVSSLEDKRSELKLKIAELSQQYTGQYPPVQAARDQLVQLREQARELQKHIEKLPSSQKQMLGLQRDVGVNTELYTALLNRAQELRVAKAGTVGNVRIVDKAVVPIRPVAPKPFLVLIIAVVFGLIVGCVVVLLRAVLQRGVSDPEKLERQTGLAVYAVIPFSGWIGRATRRAVRSGRPAPILVRDKSDAVVAEALRSLRTSLYFAQSAANSNVLIMTGPSAGVGKSFLSVNLGYLLTQVDQRVVVIDADMRRGRLHEYLATDQRTKGLSELLAGEIDITTALQRVPETQLDIIATGAIPSNPSELLMRPGFKTVLDDLRGRYDLVVVDAPPVLAVTDAAVIGATVSDPLIFMVLSSGAHPMEEVEQAVKSLTRQRAKISGFVLNGYKAGKARASQGYSQYQYQYTREA